MFRKFIYLLLIFSVFWQAGALTTGALAAQAYAAESGHTSHTVLHWQDSDHHHHDDGSLHADDSGGSAEHMQAESVGNAPGLLAADYPAPHALLSSALPHLVSTGFYVHQKPASELNSGCACKARPRLKKCHRQR